MDMPNIAMEVMRQKNESTSTHLQVFWPLFWEQFEIQTNEGKKTISSPTNRIILTCRHWEKAPETAMVVDDSRARPQNKANEIKWLNDTWNDALWLDNVQIQQERQRQTLLYNKHIVSKLWHDFTSLLFWFLFIIFCFFSFFAFVKSFSIHQKPDHCHQQQQSCSFVHFLCLRYSRISSVSQSVSQSVRLRWLFASCAFVVVVGLMRQ